MSKWISAVVLVITIAGCGKSNHPTNNTQNNIPVLNKTLTNQGSSIVLGEQNTFNLLEDADVSALNLPNQNVTSCLFQMSGQYVPSTQNDGAGGSQSFLNFTVQKISAQPTTSPDSTHSSPIPPADICIDVADKILKQSSFKTSLLGKGDNYLALGNLDFNVEAKGVDPSSPAYYRYQVNLHDKGPLLTRLIADSAGYKYFVAQGAKVDLTATVMGSLNGKYQTTSEDNSQVEVNAASNEIILKSDVCHVSAVLKVGSVQGTSDGLTMDLHGSQQVTINEGYPQDNGTCSDLVFSLQTFLTNAPKLNYYSVRQGNSTYHYFSLSLSGLSNLGGRSSLSLNFSQ